MPLSDDEQREIERLERALAAEDPKFASLMSGNPIATMFKRRLAVSALGFAGGMIVMTIGAVLPSTPVAVLGAVVMITGLYFAGINGKQLSARSQTPVPSDVSSVTAGTTGRYPDRDPDEVYDVTADWPDEPVRRRVTLRERFDNWRRRHSR